VYPIHILFRIEHLDDILEGDVLGQGHLHDYSRYLWQNAQPAQFRLEHRSGCIRW
jgi:hypothetical protein